MKTQLCNFCLNSGILCQKCLAKVKSGKVSQLDLKIARLLLSMEKKFPALQNIFFYKTIESDRTLAIIVGKGDLSSMLGQGGKIIKTIGTKLRKNIRVLEHGGNDRKFLEDLVAPLNIVTINTIWLPDGTTETKVILKKSVRKRSSLNIKAIKEIAHEVRNMTLRVEFT